MGGVLYLHNRLLMFWCHTFTDATLLMLGPTVSRSPEFQSEFEFSALFLSVKMFATHLPAPFRFHVRAENVSALRSALTYKSSSPLLTRLAAELALEQELNDRPPLEGRRIRGLLSDIADKLSRGTVAQELQHAQQLHTNIDKNMFRAWPQFDT